MAVCDRDCFNCIYADCIVNGSMKKLPVSEEIKAKKKAEQRERKRLYMKSYNKKRKVIHDEQMRKWREEHPEYGKNYYWSHKEVVT